MPPVPIETIIFKELDEDYNSWATGPNVREPGRWLLTIDKNDSVAKFLAACELVLPNEEVNARLDEINADRDDNNDAKRDEVVVPAGSVCVDGFQVAALTFRDSMCESPVESSRLLVLL